MSLKITIDGTRVLRALQQYPDIAKDELQQASNRALLGVVPDLATYPSPPPNSRYLRTGMLGRFWTTAYPVFDGDERRWVGTLGNAVSYAPYVQGTRQARVHRGRWPTARATLLSHKPRIEDVYVQAVKRIEQRINAEAGNR